ncbi:MAG: hypothetical protein ACRDIX_02530 [Actinomycetota bacterium]
MSLPGHAASPEPGRLPRRWREEPKPPQPGALRALARALVDLAAALREEEGEDERCER